MTTSLGLGSTHSCPESELILISLASLNVVWIVMSWSLVVTCIVIFIIVPRDLDSRSSIFTIDCQQPIGLMKVVFEQIDAPACRSKTPYKSQISIIKNRLLYHYFPSDF